MAHVAGIDLGSATSKVVILEGLEVVALSVVNSGGHYGLAAQKGLEEALAGAKIAREDLARIVATGCGAGAVPFASQRAAEVSCQARGVSWLFPTARTVVDIGSQASRVLRLDERGRVQDFLASEKCAAGSGRFLQIIARVLQVNLEEIGELSLKATNPVQFSTSCAVFAESEAVSRIAEGATKENILAGVHQAMAAKIASLVERIKLQKDCVITGGGARDRGLVASLKEKLGLALLVPEAPQLTAALGAALMAAEGNSG